MMYQTRRKSELVFIHSIDQNENDSTSAITKRGCVMTNERLGKNFFTTNNDVSSIQIFLEEKKKENSDRFAFARSDLFITRKEKNGTAAPNQRTFVKYEDTVLLAAKWKPA